MIRILHLIKALGRGGAEVLLREGLALANRQRFDLSYGHLRDYPDQVAAELRAQDARVDCFHLNGNARMILGARRVARHLREQRIDLVHAHLPIAGFVARIAGRLAGVPVVASDIPPSREVLGFLGDVAFVPPGDAEALAARVADLLESPRIRADLSRRGRERVRRAYSTEAMVDGYAALYRRCLAAATPTEVMDLA